jgi:hypothetical protein
MGTKLNDLAALAVHWDAEEARYLAAGDSSLALNCANLAAFCRSRASKKEAA